MSKHTKLRSIGVSCNSSPMRISNNLIKRIKQIKNQIKTEFKTKHDVNVVITDTKASKILGMFLEGQPYVKITDKGKSIVFSYK